MNFHPVSVSFEYVMYFLLGELLFYSSSFFLINLNPVFLVL